MTYEQYWYGDPLMVRAFYKADKLKQERSNTEMWLAGVYVKKALESTVGNAFLKKGEQPIEYPPRPIGLGDGKDNDEMSAEKEKQEEAQAKLYMYNMIRAGKEWGNH